MSSPSARFLLKSSALFSMMANQVRETLHHFLTAAELVASLKPGMPDSPLALASGAMIFLLIWSPMPVLPLTEQIAARIRQVAEKSSVVAAR